MSLMVILLAALCGGAFGFIVGVNIADGYMSKKTCRECRRRIVEYGFHSDGKEYIAEVKEDKNR